MAPKKKDKERNSDAVSKTSAKSSVETVETEKSVVAVISTTQQGNFPKAFERPTQMYRFMRERHQVSPLFLHRTLTYMHGRMSRSNKSRKNFKVDNMYLAKSEAAPESTEKYMTLTFLGFFDKSSTEEDRGTVKVEVSVWKACHNRRKDMNTPGIKLAIMTIEVPTNPSEDSTQQVPILSIPPETINVENLSRTIKSYSLTVRVVREQPSEDPQSKDTKKSYLEGSVFIYNSKTSCLLNQGDYEVLLHEQEKINEQNRINWFRKDNIEDQEVFNPIEAGPTIKFRLDWTLAPKSGWVNRPEFHKEETVSGDNKENRPARGRKIGTRGVRSSCRYTRLANSSKSQPVDGASESAVVKSPVSIEIRFVHSLTPTVNQSISTTYEDFRCPWCYIYCMAMYPFMKHLRLCHARFNFISNPRSEPRTYQINVTVNDTYDGKYEGSPLDIVMQPPSTNFSRDGPTHRTPVTQILVCRPKRPKPSLAEFLETEENAEPVDLQRPFVTGHGRLYHHTTTNMPVYPREMDIDSEGEKDPKWLRQKTVMMIDDFTDVNGGEKELMKLWNLHVMKYGYVGDCQLPYAHSMFIENSGKALIEKNLYRNFLLHLCNQFDFGLIPPPLVYNIALEMQKKLRKDREAVNTGLMAWRLDKKGWLESGGAGGSRDKTGKGFALAVHKTEPSHPKMASSSTFISGDGTLRRKMTQQTPQSVKKLRGGTPIATSTPNGMSQPVVLLDKQDIIEEEDDDEESKDTLASTSSNDRALRQKRKLSLQDKLDEFPAKRKRSGSLPTDTAGTSSQHGFRRKVVVPTQQAEKPVMRKSCGPLPT